jgi:hypothetical protein
VEFPVTIRHRTSKAKIYAPGGKFSCYRLAHTTAGKRRMQTFAAYSDAKAAAERIVLELANGSRAAVLIGMPKAIDLRVKGVNFEDAMSESLPRHHCRSKPSVKSPPKIRV